MSSYVCPSSLLANLSYDSSLDKADRELTCQSLPLLSSEGEKSGSKKGPEDYWFKDFSLDESSYTEGKI